MGWGDVRYCFAMAILVILILETKFRPNWEIFVFWQLFWIQNGRHSKPNDGYQFATS
jgi:hypothetical protein